MGEFCQLEEMHREGSAPAACAAGLFQDILFFQISNKGFMGIQRSIGLTNPLMEPQPPVLK